MGASASVWAGAPATIAAAVLVVTLGSACATPVQARAPSVEHIPALLAVGRVAGLAFSIAADSHRATRVQMVAVPVGSALDAFALSNAHAAGTRTPGVALPVGPARQDGVAIAHPVARLALIAPAGTIATTGLVATPVFRCGPGFALPGFLVAVFVLTDAHVWAVARRIEALPALASTIAQAAAARGAGFGGLRLALAACEVAEHHLARRSLAAILGGATLNAATVAHAHRSFGGARLPHELAAIGVADERCGIVGAARAVGNARAARPCLSVAQACIAFP